MNDRYRFVMLRWVLLQARRDGDGWSDATPTRLLHHQSRYVHSVAWIHADRHGERSRQLLLGLSSASTSVLCLHRAQVECNADQIGRFEEEVVIDISGRDQSDHPMGIPYRLIGEACVPSINITDVGSIFEEHRICRNLSVWQHLNAVSAPNPAPSTSLRFKYPSP